MGKLKVFEVFFENGVDLFRPGEWVQGHVLIVLSEPKKDIRGIQIKFEGKAKTHWTERETHGSGDHKRRETVHYYLKEKYFEEKMLILGRDKKDSSGDKVHLDAGEHKFPFRFQIPQLPLPHAYEGQYGRIRYKIRAKIDRPWKFDHTTERMFSIVGAAVDLNTIPDAVTPMRDQDEKTVCCLCCAQGPIKASCETDKKGYVPGETIYVSGMIENPTSREIAKITAKLVQNVRFRAKRRGHGFEHTRNCKTTLAKQEGEGCGENGTATFDRKPLLVPSCPPSQLIGCDIIDIKYWIEFEADVTDTPFDLEIQLPITIGTVPLYSAYPNFVAPPPGQVITQQPTNDPAFPPPAYEFAMGGLQEIPSKSGHDYTFGKMMYAPRYPYYTFPAPGDPAHPPPAQATYPPPGGDPAAAPPMGYPPPGGAPPMGYPPPGGDPAAAPPMGYPPPGGDPAAAPPMGYPPPGGDPAAAPPMGYPPPGGDPAAAPPMGYPPPGGDPATAPPMGYPPPGGDPAAAPPMGYPPPGGDPAAAPPMGYPPPGGDPAVVPPAGYPPPNQI